MRQPDLNSLAQFCVVARHLNFRQAAAELAVAPSTLSERIRDLETQLNTRLLNRTTRSASLTEDGRLLLARISDAVTMLSDTAEAVASGVDALSGLIRINGPRPALELRLMPYVTSFMSAHPGVRMELVSQGELIDIVEAGFDAGVRYEETLAQDMIAVRLGAAQRMVIAASPAYLADRGTPTHPRDLERLDCIGHIFARGNMLPWSLERAGEKIEFVPRARATVNDIDLALALARESGGLVYSFEDYLKNDLAAGRMVTVLEDWTPSFPAPSLYYPERRLMPAALRAFVDHIRSR